MKSIITILLAGIILFGISAGASWMWLVPPAEPEVAETETTDESETFPPEIADTEKVEAMPVALRPDTPVTVEAVTELAQSIMKKEKAVFDSEQKLKRDEKRIKMLFADLKRERDELDAFANRIDAKINEAREAVEILKLERKSMDEKIKALSKLESRVGTTNEQLVDDEMDHRVKVVKGWFKNLEPEQAANYLKEFADRGDIEFSARLLDSLDDRQIAKVLAAFNDAPLVAQIVDSFTKNKSIASGDRKLR